MTAHTTALRSLATALVAGGMLLAGCSGSNVEGQLELGSECTGDTDCASGLCYKADSSTGACTKSCSSNPDCPDTMLCDRVPTLGRICLPVGLGGRCRDDSECPAGHRCDTDASRCYIPVSREICSPCTSTKQCPSGGLCLTVESTGEQYCTVGCGAGGACPANFTCETVPGSDASQCIPANDSRSCNAGKDLCTPCRGDSECGDFDDYCVRNLGSGEQFCGRSCGGDSECPSGFSCGDVGRSVKQCIPITQTCAGFCDSDDPEVVRRQCGLGASCDENAHLCDQATDGRLCSACEDDDGCPSTDGATRCLANNCPSCPYKGEKFCATPCTGQGGAADPSKCPVGFFCVGIGANGAGPFHCAPKSGTCRGGAGVQGDDCTAKGAQGCLSGVCIGFGALSVCSASCTNDAQCSDPRFKCCAVTGTDRDRFDCTLTPGASGGVCSPRGGALGADCSPGQPPCFQGACLDLGTARLCSPECPADTCPENFACRTGRRPKGDGTFEDVKICFPDGGGETGADCTFGPAACRSGYCVKKSSGNVCTQPCDAATACPAETDCREVQTVDGQSLSACIPSNLP